MKKNKLLVCGLVALTAFGLAGCDKQNTGDATSIVIWATSKEIPVIEELVEKYNKDKTGSDVIKVETKAVAESDTGTTLSKDATVTGSPALFLCADDHISALAKKNIVSELKGTYKQTVLDNSTNVSVLGATYDDKLYGFPVTSDNGYFLWYNADALTAEQVGSLESILQVAKAGGKTVGFDLANGYYAASVFVSPDLCGTTSLTWHTKVEEDKTLTYYTCNWNEAAPVKACEYLSTLLKPYNDDLTLKPGTNDNIIAGFEDGSMIAAISGLWLATDLADKCEALAATKLPTYTIPAEGETAAKTVQMGSFSGSKIYCINKTRPVAEQKAAALLGQYLTSKEAQLRRFEIRETLPCNNDAIKDTRYTEHVSIGAKALLEQNAYAAVQSQSTEGNYWDVGKAIGQALLDGNLGDYTSWQEFMNFQVGLLTTER